MLVDLSPSFDNDHPANVDIFSDIYSAVHVALGAIVGNLPPNDQLMAFSLFIGYQLSQIGSGESFERTGGEFIEFATGVLLSSFGRGEK